jgi:hypothetical protein
MLFKLPSTAIASGVKTTGGHTICVSVSVGSALAREVMARYANEQTAAEIRLLMYEGSSFHIGRTWKKVGWNGGRDDNE